MPTVSTTPTEKVIIIGSGPSGWTAAIYAARASLEPLVLAGDGLNRDRMPGGQLMWTSEVENFPGFVHGIHGHKMMGTLQQQAERFGTRTKNHFVTRVDFSARPFKIWHINELAGEEEQLTLAHTVIISTGASANYLGLESERKFENNGVPPVPSAMAHCPASATSPSSSSAAATPPSKKPPTSPSSPAASSWSIAAMHSAAPK